MGNCNALTRDGKLWKRGPVARDVNWKHVDTFRGASHVAVSASKPFLVTGNNQLWSRGPVPKDVPWAVQQQGVLQERVRFHRITDGNGTVYELQTRDGSSTGQLKRLEQGKWIVMEQDVQNFAVRDDELWVTLASGDVDVTLLSGDVNDFIRRARQREASNRNSGGVQNGRGVVGDVVTEEYLVDQFRDETAPRTILDSVIKVNVNGQFNGSGTVLDFGGNQFILTAAHVIENSEGGTVAESALSITVGRNKYTVSDVFDRADFGGRDLALLKLSRAVSNIQGAVLSSVVPWNGIEVLVVGFGEDNEGNSGSKNFGFASQEVVNVDPLDFIPSNSPNVHGVGEHLTNYVSEDEAAFASGDSGGPDFAVRQRRISGQWLWVPEIVGVHSYGTSQSTSSVQLTSEVRSLIHKFIGQRRLQMEFYLYVRDDGDHSGNGAGEWYMNLEVNDVPVLHEHYREFHDNILRVGLGERIAEYELAEQETGRIKVSFYGREDDWITSDQEIPRLDATFDVPRVVPTIGQWTRIGSVDGQDTAYDLYVQYKFV